MIVDSCLERGRVEVEASLALAGALVRNLVPVGNFVAREVGNEYTVVYFVCAAEAVGDDPGNMIAAATPGRIAASDPDRIDQDAADSHLGGVQLSISAEPADPANIRPRPA
jgi:hypothetical protein